MSSPHLNVRVSGEEFNLLDGTSAGRLLEHLIPEAAGKGMFNNVRVERCWPVGIAEPTGYVLEWSFRNRKRRQAIYGQWGEGRKVRLKNAAGNCAAAQVARANGKALLTSDGVRGLRRESPGSELVLKSPDQDEMLPQLATCLSGSKMMQRLRAFGVTPDKAPGADTTLRCMLGGYRPNRRATVRFKGAGFSTVLSGKTFRDQRGRNLIQRHLLISEQLRSRCGTRIRVPAPIGFDDELNMALFVWVPGIRAENSRHGGDTLIEAATLSLSILHELPCCGREPFTKQHETAIVRRWCSSIQNLLPECGEEAGLLLENLDSTAGRIQEQSQVTIHRDFYEKQIILSPHAITMLDLDTLAAGDPCVDLGNFVSHLILRAFCMGDGVDLLTRSVHRFLEGYEQSRGAVHRGNLCFYTASSLIRLGAVHAIRTTTSQYRQALWNTAHRLLNRGTLQPVSFEYAVKGILCQK